MSDAGWSQLMRCVEEKAAQYGRTFAKIGRFEPTSQVCSACGVKDGPKPLSVREWACAACGTVHDRDVNAARNILALGRRERLNACGAGVRPPPRWRSALKQEPTGARREPRWRNPRRSAAGRTSTYGLFAAGLRLPGMTTTLFGSLAGDLTGEPGRRPPLVLLHGLTFDRTSWHPVLAELAALDPGRRVLALDLPGHGESRPALAGVRPGAHRRRGPPVRRRGGAVPRRCSPGTRPAG